MLRTPHDTNMGGTLQPPRRSLQYAGCSTRPPTMATQTAAAAWYNHRARAAAVWQPTKAGIGISRELRDYVDDHSYAEGMAFKLPEQLAV